MGSKVLTVLRTRWPDAAVAALRPGAGRLNESPSPHNTILLSSSTVVCRVCILLDSSIVSIHFRDEDSLRFHTYELTSFYCIEIVKSYGALFTGRIFVEL